MRLGSLQPEFPCDDLVEEQLRAVAAEQLTCALEVLRPGSPGSGTSVRKAAAGAELYRLAGAAAAADSGLTPSAALAALRTPAGRAPYHASETGDPGDEVRKSEGPPSAEEAHAGQEAEAQRLRTAAGAASYEAYETERRFRAGQQHTVVRCRRLRRYL